MTSLATRQSDSSLRVSTTIARVFRWLWIIFTVLVLVIVFTGTLNIFREAATDCSEMNCAEIGIIANSSAGLQSLGIPPTISAIAIITLTIITILVYILVAAYIIFRRPTEVIVIIAAFTFVSFLVGGPITASLQPDSLFIKIGLEIGEAIRVISLFAFMLAFPNGHFVPHQTRWLFLLLIPIVFVSFLMTTFFAFDGSTAVDGLTLFIGIGSQIVRYFKVSAVTERQQVKLVTWSILSLGLILMFFLVSIQVIQSESLSLLTLQVVGNVAILFLPLSILAAIQKYGLWNIDFYINRGIVLLLVTTALSAVFVVIFFGFQFIFQVLLQQEQFGLEFIVPSLAVAGLFNPVRSRVQQFVDSRFYGIKMDYSRTFQTPHQLSPHIGLSSDIGKYRIQRLLGSGGIGEVYAAQSPQGKQVAIKILQTRFDANVNLEQRFEREGQALSSLIHPNIVKMYDIGEDMGRLFIVMEYINGQDWHSIIRNSGAIPLDNALAHLEEVASALDYVHENGIIHRDIKPGNVMIEAQTNRAVLMDFGIAKIASELTALTDSDQIIGSLDYISPEQIRGTKTIDYRADIYSFAIMTYHVLTGELPFRRANVGEIAMAHLMQPPPAIRKINPNIPKSVAKAIVRGMAKNPEDRFATASEFVLHLH